MMKKMKSKNVHLWSNHIVLTVCAFSLQIEGQGHGTVFTETDSTSAVWILKEGVITQTQSESTNSVL